MSTGWTGSGEVGRRLWGDLPAARALGVAVPIVLAPMAGGPSTPELVAAVSEAGGLGLLGGGYLSPDALRDAIRAVRSLTDRPFGVNLFTPAAPQVDAELVARTIARLDRYRQELGLPPGQPPRQVAEDFDDQLAVVLAESVPVFSFTFGIPDRAALSAVREHGGVLIGTATSVAEARALEAVGAQVVCAQGVEAGAHRGAFLRERDGADEGGLVGLVALVPQVANAVRTPILASGGIMDGRGVAAALALGASGVQLGTAFLRTPEAGTSAVHRAALAGVSDTGTTITRAFSGRPARGVRNRLVAELAEADLPPYPVMNALTQDIRRAAASQGRAEYLSLWAGQGAPLARELPAGQLVRLLVEETERAIRQLGSGAR